MNAIAAEWLKLRTLRSNYYLLMGVVLAVGFAGIIATLMVADYDQSAAADQAAFPSADIAMISMPFVQFLIAVFGGLAITGEYATGAIGSSLLAVPNRGRLLAAKVTVVGGCALFAGQAMAFAALLATYLVVGGRPAPIAPWESLSEAIVPTISEGLVVTMVALVAIGLGTLLRSSAATLVSLTALLFVIPNLVFFLPSPWDQRVWVVMPSNLASQLSGNGADILSPTGAAIVMVIYVVGFVGAGAVALHRRDA